MTAAMLPQADIAIRTIAALGLCGQRSQQEDPTG
jgi:hypothetical protein